MINCGVNMSKSKVLTNQLGKTVISVAVCLLLAACARTNTAPIEDISDKGDADYTYVDDKPAYESSPSQISSHQASTNATMRDYNTIQKGSYSGDTYTVKRGDTLYYIAWITGNDYRELARKNSIAEPYALALGQVLNVRGGDRTVAVAANNTAKAVASPATETKVVNKPAVKPVIKETVATVKPVLPEKTVPKEQIANSSTTSTAIPVEKTVVTAVETPTKTATNIAWQWPVKGQIIEKFSSSSSGNKGIDIAGNIGQNIVAAASGRVVYAGNALPGYGNLIIVKHNDDYLTAYAHNDKILVQETQEVKAGQRIAQMGKTGTTSPRLHFEIRYKAKSVDPLKYLP